MWTSLQSPDHHDQHCGKLPASFSRVSWRGFSSAISFRTSSVSPPSWTMFDLIPVHVLVIFWWLTIGIFKMMEGQFVEKGDYGQRRKPWWSREDGVAPGRIYCWLSLRKTTEDQYYWFSNDRRIICFFGLFRFILLTYNSCLTLMWNRWSSRKIQTVQISWENLNWQHHDRQGVVLQYKSHGKIWPGGTLGQVGRIVLPNDGWERTQCRWWET